MILSVKSAAFKATRLETSMRTRPVRPCCAYSCSPTSPSVPLPISRRALLGAVSAALALREGPATAAKLGASAEVGAYLPSAGVEDLVLFVPDNRKTPALRAGTIRTPYQFAVPPAWTELKVSNTQSGNFCQPNCAEPWTEVVFENDTQGKLQVLVSPIIKFTPKPGTPITAIGTPDSVLQRVGSYVTGTYLDDEDVVSTSSKTQEDGRTYYYYEVNASYGTNGPHALAACTAKADNVYLFVVSANDKQWGKMEDKLRKVVETFRA